MRKSIPDEEIIDAYNNKRVAVLGDIRNRLNNRLKLPRGRATDMLDRYKLTIVIKLYEELMREKGK